VRPVSGPVRRLSGFQESQRPRTRRHAEFLIEELATRGQGLRGRSSVTRSQMGSNEKPMGTLTERVDLDRLACIPSGEGGIALSDP